MQPNQTLSAQEYLRDDAANKLEAIKGTKLELAVFLARLKRLRDEGDLDICPTAFLAMSLAMEQAMDDEFDEPWRANREIGGDVTTPAHAPSCADLIASRSRFAPVPKPDPEAAAVLRHVAAGNRAALLSRETAIVKFDTPVGAAFSLFDEIKDFSIRHENLRRAGIL